MKKHLKKFHGLLILAAMLLTMMSITAQAELVYKQRVVDYALNQLVQEQGTSYEYGSGNTIATKTYYKITIPNNGFVKLSGEDSYKTLFTSLQDAIDYNLDDNYVSLSKTKPTGIAKGVYYFLGSKTTSKLAFTRVLNTNNFCAANAIKLEPGKLVHVINAGNRTFPKWYKVVTQKKKVISIMTDEPYAIKIYNSKFKLVKFVRDSDRVYTSQPKGTYYIRVSDDYDYVSVKLKK